MNGIPSGPVRRIMLAAVFAVAAILFYLTPRPGLLTDTEFLEMVSKRTFRYFIECSSPENGQVMDRASNFSRSGFSYAPATVAGAGFGLTALTIAVERGWIDRDKARELTLKTLRFYLYKAEQINGFYFHFTDMKTGKRVWECEISSIDTALFLAGALTAAEYYRDLEIRGLAEKLYRRTDWQWMTNGRSTLCMGYKPESGFLPYYWTDYSESMILYLLAIGSPSHPIGPEAWAAIKRPLGKYREFEFISYPALFVHQFSHAWIDFRGKFDGYADYFVNSQRATLANRQFCIDNSQSFKSFGSDSWGLTACIGPDGYKAYGAPPGPVTVDGTVAPSAAGSSIVFTPAESLSAIKYFYMHLRKGLWGRYGFADSFNLDRNWFARDAYAINQGLLLIMLENFRSGLVWKLYSKTPHLEKAMKLAGFAPAKGKTLDRNKLSTGASQTYLEDDRPLLSALSRPAALSESFFSRDWVTRKPHSFILTEAQIETGHNAQSGLSVEVSAIDGKDDLFIRARVTDREIVSVSPDDKMFLDDAIEIFLDPAGNGFLWGSPNDFQLVFSPSKNGSHIRAREFFQPVQPPFRVSYERFRDGYGLVVALPKKAFGLTGRKSCGFSVALRNRDFKLGSDCKLNWFFIPWKGKLGELTLDGR